MKTVASLIGHKNKSVKEIQNQYSLSNKIDEYISLYYEIRVKGHYTDIGEYREITRIRDFIEKMAVWYEIRFPEYEVNRMFPGSNQEIKYANEIFIKENSALNNISELNAEEKQAVEKALKFLDWESVFSFETFVKSLPCEESYYFSNPIYKVTIRLENSSLSASLHVGPEGTVIGAEGFVEINMINTIPFVKGYSAALDVAHMDDFSNSLMGKNILEVKEILNEKGLLYVNNDIDNAIEDYNNCLAIKSGLLDCVMYRIIDRGGNRIGPRRAFLFANEFKKDIDIPIKYGVDTSDPGLRYFINEYTKAGGNPELECYDGYHSRKNDFKRLNIIKISDILKIRSRYTDEEKAMYQRIADVLNYHKDNLVSEEQEPAKTKIK